MCNVKLSEWIELSVHIKHIYVNSKSDTYAFKFLSLFWVSSWLYGRISGCLLCQPGFNPSFENLMCLAPLKSCDTIKKVCLWMTIYAFPPRVGVELSNEGIKCCLWRYAKLFEWIELPVAVKRIYMKKNKSDTYAFKSLCLHWVSSWLCGRIPALKILHV